MAGGNPLAPPGMGQGGPPGANPGGIVPQSPAVARPLGGDRVPMPGVRGTGASILAPAPPPTPGGATPPGASVPASQQGQPFAGVHQSLKQIQSQYHDSVKAQGVLDHLREELDQLMEKGDTVRPEHVIEAAGRLVGHGIGATELARIMSDMPAQGGEGLASWIRMHDVTVTNAEQQLVRENTMLQHQMGVAGIRSIAASHMEHEAVNGPKPPTRLTASSPQAFMAATSPGGMPQGGGGDGDMMADSSEGGSNV